MGFFFRGVISIIIRQPSKDENTTEGARFLLIKVAAARGFKPPVTLSIN